MSVELTLVCEGTTPHHEVRLTFGDKTTSPDWKEINRLLAMQPYRCQEHPEYHTYYYDQ